MLSNATIQSHQIFQNSISNIQNSKKIASYIWDNVGGRPELIDSPLRGEKGLRHQGANVQHQPRWSKVSRPVVRRSEAEPWRMA